jgi:hypothetical protein
VLRRFQLTHLGIHVAEKSLFINIARIMWGFDVQKPAEGNWKVNNAEGGGFHISKNDPNIRIRPRSAQHEKVLREEWAKAKKEGLHYQPAPREVFSGRVKV